MPHRHVDEIMNFDKPRMIDYLNQALAIASYPGEVIDIQDGVILVNVNDNAAPVTLSHVKIAARRKLAYANRQLLHPQRFIHCSDCIHPRENHFACGFACPIPVTAEQAQCDGDEGVA